MSQRVRVRNLKNPGAASSSTSKLLEMTLLQFKWLFTKKKIAIRKPRRMELEEAASRYDAVLLA